MKTGFALLFTSFSILLNTATLACDTCGVSVTEYDCGCYDYSVNCEGTCCPELSAYNPCCKSDACNYSTGCDNGCGTTSCCDPCGDWVNQYGYEHVRPCDCNCTDNGWRYNNCVSRCEYCEAFGNVGAR